MKSILHAILFLASLHQTVATFENGKAIASAKTSSLFGIGRGGGLFGGKSKEAG